MKITKKRYFFKNRWNAYFYNDFSAYGKTTAAPKRSFGLSRAPPGPPWLGTLFLGTPPERPGGEPFPPGTPPGLPQDQPWRPQGRPKSPQGGPGAPKGHIKSTK